ncbi:polymorphic toxin type 15 domain-containing protein [Campylobacterota bacterium DY0563]
MAAKKVAKKVATLPLKAVPILGWAMAAYDVYDTVSTGIDIYDMVKEYDAVEEAGKKLADCKKKAEAQKKNGTKVKSLKQTKVKCFNKKQKKHDGAEYDKQLKNQQDGLNSMSADEYIEGRKSFLGYNPCNKNQKTTQVKRNPNEARNARKAEQLRRELEYDNAGHPNPSQAAKDDMKILAALHNPDMIAGGMDKITGFGDRGINSSIGSQWKDRVGDIDADACQAQKEGKGKNKMNTELKRCKK